MRVDKPILLSIVLSLVISCSPSTEVNKQLSNTPVDKATNIPVETDLKLDTTVESNGITRINKSEIHNPAFPLEDLFGIWTTDPNGPHADFRLDSNSFYIVDYDGDGDMPYILKEDSLTIFFSDFISKNKILKVDSDSLILESDSGIIKNVRWKN